MPWGEEIILSPISKALCLFRSFFFSALAHQYDSNANQSNQNHGNGWAHNGKQTGGDDALAFILKRCLNDFVVAATMPISPLVASV